MKDLIYFTLAFIFVLSPMHLTWMINSFSCTDVIEIPQDECEALVALYNNTGGVGWTNHTNWLASDTPSNWFGISVDAGHVRNLQLSNNRLIGTIPAQISDLHDIFFLFLSNNQLNGNIPTEIGNLLSLQGLYLWGNQLTGSIPPEIGSLVNLVSLNLSDNLLEGNLPPQMGNLFSLTGLILNDNTSLSGALPLSLSNLPLSYFSFDNTHLCEPDDSVFQSWLNNIQNLKRTGAVCGQAFTCATVTQIAEIECEALVSFYNSTNGDGWHIHDNWLFSNTPSNWDGLLVNSGSVRAIVLKGNNLSGKIPQEIGNLTGLTYIFLNNNSLQGAIPSTIGNLSNLEYLRFESNKLRGNIPPELGNLTLLEILWLHNNYLSGDIPDSLTNLVNLIDANQLVTSDALDLDYNYLDVPVNYPEPGNLLHSFLYQKDPDWHFRQFSYKTLFMPVILR